MTRPCLSSSVSVAPAKRKRLICRASRLNGSRPSSRPRRGDPSLAAVDEEAGSIPRATKTPPENACRNLAGRVRRFLSSSACSYSPRSIRGLLVHPPLRPTLTHRWSTSQPRPHSKRNLAPTGTGVYRTAVAPRRPRRPTRAPRRPTLLGRAAPSEPEGVRPAEAVARLRTRPPSGPEAGAASEPLGRQARGIAPTAIMAPTSRSLTTSSRLRARSRPACVRSAGSLRSRTSASSSTPARAQWSARARWRREHSASPAARRASASPPGEVDAVELRELLPRQRVVRSPRGRACRRRGDRPLAVVVEEGEAAALGLSPDRRPRPGPRAPRAARRHASPSPVVTERGEEAASPPRGSHSAAAATAAARRPRPRTRARGRSRPAPGRARPRGSRIHSTCPTTPSACAAQSHTVHPVARYTQMMAAV